MKKVFHDSSLLFFLLCVFVSLLFLFAVALQFCLLSKNFAIHPPQKINVFIPEIPKKDIVVALLPHQDDELFMAGKIMQFAEEGKDVYAAVVTDGGASRIRSELNKKGYTELDRQHFAKARNHEVYESLQYLGISADHILFLNTGDLEGTGNPKFMDGTLSLDQASDAIQELYVKFGDGIYMSVAGGHSDHVALEKALKNFSGISKKIFFPLNEFDGNQEYILTDLQMLRKRAAISAYNVWNPKKEEFAIGASSVEGFMEDWTKKTKEVYYEVLK